MLIFGLTLFAALPTTPPWMTPDSTLTVDAGSPERVYRVTTIMLGQGDDYVFAEDGNPIAAMPSIHMATTFLLLLLLWSRGRLWRSVGIAYTVAMAFLLVYYDEHYVLDELAGIVLAIGGWKLAIRWLGDWSPSLQRRFQRTTALGSAPTAQPASPTM
jgi:membrane-associated phospholipid phosphatase